MSGVKKSKEDTRRRFKYIITNYMEARQSIDESKTELSETSRELDEVINNYNRLYKFYDQIPAVPSGSFSQFQETSLGSLLVSACSNATMALGAATKVKKAIPHFSAVVSSGSSVVLSIAEITRNIAEGSNVTSRLIEGWNLPTPRENQTLLGTKLHGIEPRLEVKLNGAWQTVYDRSNTDRFRQASSSMRELISDTLQVLAPDLEIENTLWFKPETQNGVPTQTQRAHYAIVGKNETIDEKDLRTAFELAKNIRASYKELNRHTHERGNRKNINPNDLENQLISVLNQTQIYLLEIFRMREKYFMP